MADELKRIFVEYPGNPGAGAYFTGDNAEKEAQEFRDALGIVTKEASAHEDKAVKKPSTK